ncbi:MAG: hypothetical protein AAF614_20750 [Chloroflexota bacterium]
MTGPCITLSPALAAAQNRLAALRQARGVNTLPSASAKPVLQQSLVDVIQQLPPHLGWESLATTAVLRPKSVTQTYQTAKTITPCVIDKPARQNDDAKVYSRLRGNDRIEDVHSGVHIRLYPSLALGMLREKQVAAGRVWLLLRHLDMAGRGWHTLESVRVLLTIEEAPHRLCGWRQLRKLLGRGDGIFWERRNGHLWLRNTAKVAATLGVEKLNGRSVALPLNTLLQPIGHIRAHFYASFHSSRSHDKRGAAPISRETLAKLSNTNRQTQRLYEAKIGIRPQQHFALGRATNPAAQEETLWQKGKAAFIFTDHQGQHGAALQKYAAWQLPNSYTGPHQRLNKGRQKQLNRRLADLRNLGIAGNGNCQERERLSFGLRRYVLNSYLAAKAKSDEAYWPAPLRKSVGLWYQGKKVY